VDALKKEQAELGKATTKELQHVETKPTETKHVDTPHLETRPADPRHADAQHADPQRANVKQPETQQAETQHVKTEHVIDANEELARSSARAQINEARRQLAERLGDAKRRWRSGGSNPTT
jgi:hypothetical protein